MRLTAFTDFGLRTLMRLAGQPDRLFTTEEIAAEYAISRHHLVKVVRDLAAAGFIETRRGTGGGFRLARPAYEISIGDVVRALESRAALVECFRSDGGQCALSPACQLKGHLARARDAFLVSLDAIPLSDCAVTSVTRQPSPSRAVRV